MANLASQKLSAILKDDLADVADAERALDVLWTRLRGWCRKPYVSVADVDSVSDELRRVEAGLLAVKKYLVAELEREEGK